MDPVGWLQGSYNQPKTGSSSKSPISLQITRPTTMPHPELNVGFWQSKFKVGDHGAVHGLEWYHNENALKMMGFIVDMPNRPNVKWFDHGTYQGQTERGYPAVHIYDFQF